MDGDYPQGYGFQENFRLKDLEEKQNILKERLLLIGQNFLDFKDEHSEKVLELKKEFEAMKEDIGKIKSFLESISMEMGKLARKEEFEILRKQAKMFQPLEFLKKS